MRRQFGYFATYKGDNRTNKACQDGYDYDNIIEGIKFVFEIKGDGELDVYIDEKDKKYVYDTFSIGQIEEWISFFKDNANSKGERFLPVNTRLGYDNNEVMLNEKELYLYDKNGNTINF